MCAPCVMSFHTCCKPIVLFPKELHVDSDYLLARQTRFNKRTCFRLKLFACLSVRHTDFLEGSHIESMIVPVQYPQRLPCLEDKSIYGWNPGPGTAF